MNTHRIRNMIAAAKQHEMQTGALNRVITDASHSAGRRVSAQDVVGLVAIITMYIENVPTLLDEASRVARKAGWWNTIAPMFEAAEKYFFEPNDLVPDSYGLLGLLDDAYLCNTLIQCLSDSFKQQTGRPLVSADLNAINGLIRVVLGNDVIAALDNCISILLQGPSMQSVLQCMVALAAGSNIFLPAGMYDDPQIKQQVDLQMALITTS